MKKTFLGSILLCGYLLASSVFFHASAMNLIQGMDMEDCPMHTQSSESKDPTNNNCFQTCMGEYNELFAFSVEEQKYSFHHYDFASPLFVYEEMSTIYNVAGYPQLIDSGGPPCHFLNTYIDIIKKLE